MALVVQEEPFICFLSVERAPPALPKPCGQPIQTVDLGTKINQQLQPVFTSKKIADHLRVTEEKPPLINQQSVVYEFICDLCDTNYIGYTCRHLHQRVEEHKHSVIGKHFRDAHGLTPTNLIKNFKVLKKCRSKLDCLMYEMLWIKNKVPSQLHSLSSLATTSKFQKNICFQIRVIKNDLDKHLSKKINDSKIT